jgi:hypothetical protein
MIIMVFGFSSMNYLYLYGAPFCLNSFGVSLTAAAQIVTTILLIIPFTLAVGKYTDHLAFAIFGCLTSMTQLILYGIANQVWMIYLAVCIGAVYSVLAPIVRCRITKLVEPNEYACVFILASIFESGGTFAISAMTNEIYRISLTFYSGLVFFVLATFCGMAVILML